MTQDKERKSNEKGKLMQQFIMDISAYTRERSERKAGFIIIPQNGLELAFNNLDEGESLHPGMMRAIDGFGVEELFYDGKLKVDKYRLGMCKKIAKTHTIMVSDHVKKEQEEKDATERSTKEGFLSFIRSAKNYEYREIRPCPNGENSNNICGLKDAKNYLYLINPESFANKNDMLQKLSSTNYDVIIMDAFYHEELLSRADVERLKTKANGGKRLVISYVNIGAAENFRHYWQKEWKLHNPKFLKKPYDGYHEEMWVKFWDPAWQDIVLKGPRSYIQMVLDANFDGVYLDNVEAYYTIYFD